MVTPSIQEIEQDVLAALRAEGLCPETPLELDGRLHRCPVEGRPHGRDGAYQIHTDNCPAGWYQNHVGNRPIQTWKYKGAKPTPEEEARFRREMEQARKEREKETREGYAKAVAFIKAASPLFSPASPEHPYLQRKRVGVFGDLAQADGAQLAALYERETGQKLALSSQDPELILRLRDAGGKIWTLERIKPDGSKRFLAGGKKAGMWYTIPAAEGREDTPLVIAEGYATGASIHMATGYEVAVALDCGNLDKTAAACRKKWPAREILFGADNDVGTIGNPGLSGAQNAARKVGGRVILPEPLEEGKGVDWNDVHVALGLDAVRKAFVPELDAPPLPDDGALQLQDVSPDLADGMEPPLRSELIPEDLTLLSDVSNAALLLKLHGENLRYCREWKDNGWLIWDGKRWMENSGHRVTQMAIDAVKRLRAERTTLAGADERKELDKHIKTSLKLTGIRAMVALAHDLEPVQVRAKDLNAQPWLLNTPSGTLDIKRRVLSRHKREDLLTRMIATEFDKDAQCPRWLAFLDTIMGGDQEMVAYLKRAVGYCLTGSTDEQCMFVLYGSGRNGKSTFLQAIRELLGDYARQASMDTFMYKYRGSTSSDDLANLQGARMVVASESEENSRLSESLVKQITGGGAITARRLYENLQEFIPEFKIWLDTNHKPVVKGTDLGIWRRIRLIPFTVTIPEEEVDPELPQKLREEFPGILAWAAQGAKEWQDGGLGHPAAMEVATAAYRAEMDTIGRFLAEKCVQGEGFRIGTADLYKLYLEWIDESGEFSKLTAKQLGLKLQERGFTPGRNHGGRYWEGLQRRPYGYDEDENDEAKIPF
ncbi:phage/plasmid primase, P4 family [Pyramidobacter piscolens]|uniref:phage/plasmid primase, P4 family n=1 Tax=Pyramidobacter piscolens TaxID=638849 RepID=UPI001FCAD0C1|nr:phage/plasmid primase, P4 family [Pyramidobacter piscolens]BDF77858.1 hypothetical protein CE91St28_06520 [Pyramidobacter piscolens]